MDSGIWCENSFCIYWNGNFCILDKITLDRMGICTKCIYVSIEEEDLKKKRNALLKKYD